MANKTHRIVVSVADLIEEARAKVITVLGKLDGCTDEGLLAMALDERRKQGWCDAVALQIGEDGNRRWCIVFHFHKHCVAKEGGN